MEIQQFVLAYQAEQDRPRAPAAGGGVPAAGAADQRRAPGRPGGGRSTWS